MLLILNSRVLGICGALNFIVYCETLELSSSFVLASTIKAFIPHVDQLIESFL